MFFQPPLIQASTNQQSPVPFRQNSMRAFIFLVSWCGLPLTLALAAGKSMSILKRSPISGPSVRLNEEFEEWWYVLNGIGIVAFELFLECSGNDENGYFYALLSTVLVAWLLYIAKDAFPAIVKKFRSSTSLEHKTLARQIGKDYLGVVKMPLAYFPYLLGTGCLLGYTLYPITQQAWNLYIPSFLRCA